MQAPQIIWLVIMALNLLLTANLHGQSKKPSKYNFFVTFVGLGLEFALLAWGGFFN